VELMRFLSLEVDSTPVWINPEDVSSIHADSVQSASPRVTLEGSKVCMKSGTSFSVKGGPDMIVKMLAGERP
jgi:hypothetical protein